MYQYYFQSANCNTQLTRLLRMDSIIKPHWTSTRFNIHTMTKQIQTSRVELEVEKKSITRQLCIESVPYLMSRSWIWHKTAKSATLLSIYMCILSKLPPLPPQHLYCIAGNFGKGFNLVNWQFCKQNPANIISYTIALCGSAHDYQIKNSPIMHSDDWFAKFNVCQSFPAIQLMFLPNPR